MKKDTETVVQDGLQEIEVQARFVMRSFESLENGKPKENEYLSFELVNPFNDPDFTDIALKAKWDRYDDNGRLVRPDRVFGYMKYYAQKEIKHCSEIPVVAKIRAVSYTSKTGNVVAYPAIFVNPTFADIQDEKPVEMTVKGAQNANIFGLLAGKALNIKFNRASADESDIGL